jgi:hypothetical protein
MSEPENTTDSSQQEEKTQKANASSGVVLFKGDIKIFPNQPLPHLDRGTAKAYLAETKSGSKAFAMICPDNLVPRTAVVHKYMNVVSTSLPKISASGVVDWPLEKREKYTLIYEGNMGKPLSSLRPSQALGLKLDAIINTVFYNLVDAISSMHDRGITHGNVCLQNIFDGGGSTFENVILGECLSVPCGFAQPFLYETIERSLASPMAKGEATYPDDIYALGICLALMLSSHDFTEGMSAEEVTLHKLEHGTFNLVTSRDRLPGKIMELLRGVLSDDVSCRWTIWEIEEWMDGRRVTGKQGARPVPKSSRPVEFRKKKYFRPDILATQLRKDPSAALELVESGELYLWLNRALQSKEYEERFETAVEQAKKSSSGANYAERMVSYITMALAPNFPVYYRNQNFFPDSIGHLMVDAVSKGSDVNVFVEIFQGDIIPFWATFRYQTGLLIGDEPGKFETCRMYLLQKSPGFGIERCVYHMAPSAKCLSEKLKFFYTRSSEDIVLALEAIGGQKDKSSWFFDRHIIAYLFSHDKSVIESSSADLISEEKHRQINAALKIFSKVQEREKIQSLPNLSAWVGGYLEILITRYHDRERRKNIKIEADKVKAKGNLVLLAEIFNNLREIQDDTKMFSQAMMHYQNLQKEYHRLNLELETNKGFGKGTGHQIATMVSGGIAGLVILIYLFVSVSTS